MRQFILPPEYAGEGTLVLHEKEHHYLSRVLRLSPGDAFPALDRQGNSYSCRIEGMNAESTTLELLPSDRENRASGTEITLMMGIPKGKKMDQVIRQATECGVRRIVPLLSEHSAVRLDREDAGRKQERWSRVAREALQQSGTTVPPEIMVPVSPSDLGEIGGSLDRILYFHEKPLGPASLHELLPGQHARIGLLIGPEGGFSRRELELFSALDYDSVYLGDSVLRAETAAIYAIAAVQTILRESRIWQLKSQEHGT